MENNAMLKPTVLIDQFIEKFFILSMAWPSFVKLMLKISPPEVNTAVISNINQFLNKKPDLSKKADSAANQKATAYRNGCVFLSILGILTFYLAILPYALDIPESVEHLVGTLEIVAFVVTAGLVFYLINKKKQWTQNRSQAEERRYENLKSLASQKNVTEELTLEFTNHLAEQLAYNNERIVMYESIEEGSKRLTWAFFLITFGAVVAHMIYHQEWLLLVTAGFPMMIAATHALNSLANVPRLTDDHKHIYSKLKKIDADFQKNGDQISSLATRLYEALTNNDEDWKVKTLEHSVNPG